MMVEIGAMVTNLTADATAFEQSIDKARDALARFKDATVREALDTIVKLTDRGVHRLDGVLVDIRRVASSALNALDACCVELRPKKVVVECGELSIRSGRDNDGRSCFVDVLIDGRDVLAKSITLRVPEDDIVTAELVFSPRQHDADTPAVAASREALRG